MKQLECDPSPVIIILMMNHDEPSIVFNYVLFYEMYHLLKLALFTGIQTKTLMNTDLSRFCNVITY